MYFKTREKIFIAAFTIGVPMSGIWFLYRSTETLAYFDIRLFRSAEVYICMFASFLPSLAIYVLLYAINRLLIKNGAPRELALRRQEIIKNLAKASIANTTVQRAPRDLVDECAWASVKEFWSKE